MQDVTWIPIGKGDESELEEVVETLKKRWQKRWYYRIEETDEDADDTAYRLLVAHQ